MCKKSLAVVAIDIDILKWVNFVAMDKTIKTYFFKSEKTEHEKLNFNVNELLCQSLLPLMFYPNVYRYIEKDLNEFIEALKELYETQRAVYETYARSVASLLSPLSEGYFREMLISIIAQSSIQSSRESAFTHLRLAYEYFFG